MVKLHELDSTNKTKKAVKIYWAAISEACSAYRQMMKKAPRSTKALTYRRLERKADAIFKKMHKLALDILCKTLGILPEAFIETQSYKKKFT